MIQKNNFSLKKVKKALLQRGYGIYKKQKKNTTSDSQNLFFVFCFSLVLITTFGLLPKTIKLINKSFYKSETIENNSKMNIRNPKDITQSTKIMSGVITYNKECLLNLK